MPFTDEPRSGIPGPHKERDEGLMKFGVVVFPGSNCDHDAYHVVSKVIGQPVDFIWHKEQEINGYDAIILPGGFSYGDYLRTGAIARFSPVMKAVKEFAHDGGIVLGICNGFQILCEAGLLPGALLRNRDLKMMARHCFVQGQSRHGVLGARGQIVGVDVEIGGP